MYILRLYVALVVVTLSSLYLGATVPTWAAFGASSVILAVIVYQELHNDTQG